MTLDGSETYRRLPSLNLIRDREIRGETAAIAAEAPDYYWSAPATQSDSYHNPLCRGKHGLWIHTLMLSTVIERLRDSRVELGQLTGREIDMAHSAAILHDQRKLGDPEDPSTSSVSDHDLRMARVVSESDLPEAVSDAISTHMGPWYDGPDPSTEIEQLVHDADMIASARGIDPKLPAPAPEELIEIGAEEIEL